MLGNAGCNGVALHGVEGSGFCAHRFPRRNILGQECEVGGSELTGGGIFHQQSPLNQILQFSDITRERKRLEIADGLCRDGDKRETVCLTSHPKEVINQ